MKTTQLVLAGIFGFSVLVSSAQVTQAVNAISASSYVGTSNNFDVVFKRQAVAAGLLSTTSTSFGVNSKSMTNSSSFGVNAGQFSSGIGNNTYIGHYAGRGQSASVLNSGHFNTFIGISSGTINTTGYSNAFVGAAAGMRNTTGYSNAFIGSAAGSGITTGYQNVIIGAESGCEDCDTSFGNVFIGYNAGFDEYGSNKLIIGNNASSRLLDGDFNLNQLKLNAKVGIGYGFGNYPTTAGGVNVSTYNLFVKGGILTEEVRVSLGTSWADYVFAKDYELPTLAQVEKHIAEKGHLINVPSAAQVKEEGIALGEMSKIQQEKIEELTLYLIEQNKINDKQEKEIAELKALVLQMAAKK